MVFVVAVVKRAKN